MSKDKKNPLEGLRPWEIAKKLGRAEYKKERTGRGRPKAIPTPERFWELACDYFQHVDDQPFEKVDFIKSGERGGQLVNLPTIRPYTWSGFEKYLLQLGIINDVERYRGNEGGAYDDFRGVCHKVDLLIKERKFEGAVLNVFNPSIIAYDLGMKAKEDPEKLSAQVLEVVISEKKD